MAAAIALREDLRCTPAAGVGEVNASGAAGLVNRKAAGKQPLLNAAQRRELAAVIERGPIPATEGVVRWRLIDLTGWVYDSFGIATSKQTLSRIVRMGYRKLSERPRHHAQGPVAVAAFEKTSLHLAANATSTQAANR